MTHSWVLRGRPGSQDTWGGQGTGIGMGVGIGIYTGLGMGMGIDIGIGIGMGVGIDIGIGIGMGIGIGICIGMGIGKGIGMGTGLGMGMGIGIGIGVGLGLGMVAMCVPQLLVQVRLQKHMKTMSKNVMIQKRNRNTDRKNLELISASNPPGGKRYKRAYSKEMEIRQLL